MNALSVAKLKMFSPESEIFLWIKPKKEKKTFFVESLDQCRRLEVREKARNVFVMSLRLSDHKVLHNIASSSIFFRFRSDFLAFFALISYFKFLEFKEFNKTIIPFALVGYETGYSQLGATRLVGYLPSHIQRALIIYIYIGKPKSGAPQFFSYCMAFTDKLINININVRTRARTLIRTCVLWLLFF